MITVQPIRYTSHPEQWHRLALALGFVPAFPPRHEWSEFDGEGILAIHHTDPGQTQRTTELHLLTDDLEGAEARLTAAGFSVRATVLADIGPMLIVTASSGAAITISGAARPVTPDSLAVQPIWYQSDLAEPRLILETIGLRPRIASKDGGWVDFTADGGGLAAIHSADEVRFELSLQLTGDLDALAARLAEAGFPASVVDEAYNRTLRVLTPDGDELWVNGEWDDLYGYAEVEQG